MSVDLLTNAQSELDQLRSVKDRLAESLAAYAERLRESGALPSEALLVDLRDYRTRLLAIATGLSGEPPRASNLVPTYESLGEDVTWVGLSEYVQRSRCQIRALAVLQHVAGLRHKDDPYFPALSACQQHAAELQKLIVGGENSVAAVDVRDALNSGNHPLSSLITLIQDVDSLSDDRWTELNDQIVQAFGRSLSTAVARGKVAFTNTPVVASDGGVVISATHLNETPASRVSQSDANPSEMIQPSHVGGTSEDHASTAWNVAAAGSEFESDTSSIDYLKIDQLNINESGIASFLTDKPTVDSTSPGVEQSDANSLPLILETGIRVEPTAVNQFAAPGLSLQRDPGCTSIFESDASGPSIGDSGSLSANESEQNSDRETGEQSRQAASESEVSEASSIVSASKSQQVEPSARNTAEKSRTESILMDSDADSIFDAIGSQSKVKIPGRISPALDLKLLSDAPFPKIVRSAVAVSSPQAAAVQAANSVASLARHTVQLDGDARHTQLSKLVLQLLSEGRLAVAYQLTLGIESRLKGTESVPPSRLIRAMLLGRHICYARGEISRMVEEDLKALPPQLLTSGDSESNAATGLFVRAAALIPALLSSSPTASAILRSFRITPGLSHLYNYCSRLSNYGHKLQGQAADLFTPDCDLTNWECETSALRESIESWLTSTIQRNCPTSRSSLLFLHAHWTLMNGSVPRFAEAARSWSKWQECIRLVHRLLKPALYGAEHERTWVKTEIDRLTQLVHRETLPSDQQASRVVGAIEFPQEEMVRTIREGVDFASRWLRLCASKPAQGRTLVSREAEALRDEILERTDSVLAELLAFSEQNPAPRTRAAIATLCGTIEHLRSIFSPHSTLALRESDPRHVLYGELLKIPHLRMNDQWMPTVDPLTLENEILTSLGGEPRDWKRAFEIQCVARDHVATDRILQLNVWRTDQERDSLKRRRASELQVCREELQGELNELTQWLANESQHPRLGANLRSEFEQRLEQLNKTVASTIDFAAVQGEIAQLRMTVERRKRDLLQGARRISSAGFATRPTLLERNQAGAESPSERDVWSLNILSDN